MIERANLFSIPFSVSNSFGVEYFIAREAELVKMHAILNGDSSPRMVVLHGLGGMGKTQLSIAYAKRHKDNYSAIFWLDMSNKDSLKHSFAVVAKQIFKERLSASQIGNFTTYNNLDNMVDAVKGWLNLSNNTRWLIIYDNYNPNFSGNIDPAAVDIRDYLPASHQGSIIITTRSWRETIGYNIRIGKLENIRDSLKILCNASCREGLIDGKDLLDAVL